MRLCINELHRNAPPPGTGVEVELAERVLLAKLDPVVQVDILRRKQSAPMHIMSNMHPHGGAPMLPALRFWHA